MESDTYVLSQSYLSSLAPPMNYLLKPFWIICYYLSITLDFALHFFDQASYCLAQKEVGLRGIQFHSYYEALLK